MSIKSSSLVTGAFALAVFVGLPLAPSQAAGCLKGAAVGGLAGHMAGHGWLGAGVGCAIGHHRANNREREESRRNAMEDERQWREYGGGQAFRNRY